MTWLNKTHIGDCRELLKRMAADGVRVQTCVTSPPYFGLRDYGHAGQIGLEQTPAEYVEQLTAVFRAVREVLADDGTLWLNLGDSYAGSGRGGYIGGASTLQGSTTSQDQSRIARGSQLAAGLHESAREAGQIGRAWVPPPPGLKQKDLIGIPWTVAFALRAEGWYLRSDIIWHKPNPMPESVTDRPTKAHEYLFLLSKQERYYYDAEAILERCSESTHARLSQNVQAQIGSERANGGAKTNGPMKAVGRKFDPGAGNKNNASFDAAMAIMPEKRNRRTVWTIPTESFKGAHFATFPRALIEPCILAGAPAAGVVLDPFMGSGTTGQVSTDLGRQFIGCELNPKYVELHDMRRTTTGMAI